MNTLQHITLKEILQQEAHLECMEAYLVKDTEYSWEFLCMVQGDGEEDITRMYIHK